MTKNNERKENQKLSALKRAYNNNEQAALVFSLYEAAKVKGHFFSKADVTTTKDRKKVTEKVTVITKEKLRDLEKALGIDHAKAADSAKGYICFLDSAEANELLTWLSEHIEKREGEEEERERKAKEAKEAAKNKRNKTLESFMNK